MKTTIFPARKIITMNPARPLATHVAIRDGRILGVGALEELAGWGPYTLDDRLADKVLMPGLVEGHSHLMEGAFWRFVYCGFFDRRDPNGKSWPGAKSLDAVLQRLNEAQAALPDAATPLAGWGFDPIYFDNRRCVRQDLDRVSTTRPVGMIHASGHIINCNSAALATIGWLRSRHRPPGRAAGQRRFAHRRAEGPRSDDAGGARCWAWTARSWQATRPGLSAFSRLCVRAGVTTATDLASPLPDAAVDMMLRVTAGDEFPTRIVPLLRLMGAPTEGVERAATLRARSSDRLRLGRIKMVADGSIQGFSARLRWPGYYNGAPNGLWYMAPEQMQQALGLALQRGLQHPHPHQRRRSHRTAARADGTGAARTAHARPPLHAAALPVGRCGAVPAHEGAGDVRQPLRQPPLLLGRRALPRDRRPGTRHAHERLRHRAGHGRALCHPQRRADHAAGPAVHRLVRGAPAAPPAAGCSASTSASA